jgi:hypothetical protein
VTLSPPTNESVFSFSKWSTRLGELRARYRNNQPFPHIVLEDFLQADILDQGLAEFPPPGSRQWIHYIHYNERKFGKTDMENFPPTLKKIVQELNSDEFLKFLTDLTGIQGLIADPKLEGGGLHQTPRGGHLNIHADFTSHPHRNDWRRRVNVLVYLNKNWQDSYGGHLELWDKDMKQCRHKVAPIFNRCVIFNTDADAFHGHPDPLQCPEGITRKSIALYYFTKEKSPLTRSTNYRARPGDGLKRIAIFLDKMLLSAYDRFKRFAKIEDSFVSNRLRDFDRWKKKWSPDNKGK